MKNMKFYITVFKCLYTEIPGKLGDVQLVEKCELEKLDQRATLYMVKISRNASWEYMMEAKQKQPLFQFYTYKEFYKTRVLAMYECPVLRKNFVVHPYNRNQVTI